MTVDRELRNVGIDLDAQRPAVAAVLTFIAEHYREPFDSGRIAAAGGYTQRGMQEALRRDLHRTAIRIVTELRLQAAREILRHGPKSMTVKDVATRVNMPHAGRFSIRYRRMFGETPAETMRSRTS